MKLLDSEGLKKVWEAVKSKDTAMTNTLNTHTTNISSINSTLGSKVDAGSVNGKSMRDLGLKSFVKSVYPSADYPSPGKIWYNVLQMVHTNGSGSDSANYIAQIAVTMTASVNRLFFRSRRTDPWVEAQTLQQVTSAIPFNDTTGTVASYCKGELIGTMRKWYITVNDSETQTYRILKGSTAIATLNYTTPGEDMVMECWAKDTATNGYAVTY